MKKFTEDLIKSIVIGLIVGVFSVIGIRYYQISRDLQKMQTNYNIANNEVLSGIVKQLNKLDKKTTEIPQKIESDKVKLEKTLQQVNIEVRNITVGGLGSGATVKYKGKFYVLSAGHMAEENTDKLELWENGNKVCDLKIIKHEYTPGEITTKSQDLLLLRPTNENIEPKFYTELADSEPLTGTEVYIVGNPLGIEDVVSKGRVAIYIDNFMYFRDSTYFGNSGGGLYNAEGKLIGIMSHVSANQPFPDFPAFVIEGAVRLDVIKEFLENVR